jgi:hypothetical protein
MTFAEFVHIEIVPRKPEKGLAPKPGRRGAWPAVFRHG